MIRIGILGLLFLLIACQNNSPNQESLTASERKVYKEKHRPQYHFSPAAAWMNDPNGMVYLDGEYHLFYQYYPDSTVWGPMHWGHAVSEDLVSWENLPIALYPDSLGYIFSGSAVIDHGNTAGFGEDAMVAIFTYHDIIAEQSGMSNTYQYQAIAYSSDKGRTFTKYEGNPVVENPGIKDFRDPKVIWDEASQQWVMVFAAYDHVKIYGSPDLKNWVHLSNWGKNYGTHAGVWECPDLFPIEVHGSDEKKYVLLQSINPGAPNGGSGTMYFIGDFDGKNFIIDPEFESLVTNENAVWLDYGTDNYAGVTWSNTPISDDQRLFIGWMSNWQYAQVVPEDGWRSAMTLSRILTLHHDNGQYRLRSNPVDKLKNIEKETVEIESKVYSAGEMIAPLKEALNKIQIQITNQDDSFSIELSNTIDEKLTLGYDADNHSYYIDRSNAGIADFEEGFAKKHMAPLYYQPDTIDWVIYLDRSSIEVFADGGKTVMTDIVFPDQAYTELKVTRDSRSINIRQGSVIALNGIWN